MTRKQRRQRERVLARVEAEARSGDRVSAAIQVGLERGDRWALEWLDSEIGLELGAIPQSPPGSIDSLQSKDFEEPVISAADESIDKPQPLKGRRAWILLVGCQPWPPTQGLEGCPVCRSTKEHNTMAARKDVGVACLWCDRSGADLAPIPSRKRSSRPTIKVDDAVAVRLKAILKKEAV